MRPVVYPSKVPHAWRGAWALVAVAVWWMLAVYLLVVLAARLLGPMPYAGPVFG